MEPAIPTTTIHLKGDGGEPLKPLVRQVLSFRHLPDNPDEGDELLLFAAQ